MSYADRKDVDWWLIISEPLGTGFHYIDSTTSSFTHKSADELKNLEKCFVHQTSVPNEFKGRARIDMMKIDAGEAAGTLQRVGKTQAQRENEIYQVWWNDQPFESKQRTK